MQEKNCTQILNLLLSLFLVYGSFFGNREDVDLNYGWRKSTVQKQIFTTRHLAIEKKKGPLATLAASSLYVSKQNHAGTFRNVACSYKTISQSSVLVQAVSVVGLPAVSPG